MCPIPQNVASYKRLKEKGVSETQTDRNEYSDQFSYILQKFDHDLYGKNYCEGHP